MDVDRAENEPFKVSMQIGIDKGGSLNLQWEEASLFVRCGFSNRLLLSRTKTSRLRCLYHIRRMTTLLWTSWSLVPYASPLPMHLRAQPFEKRWFTNVLTRCTSGHRNLSLRVLYTKFSVFLAIIISLMWQIAWFVRVIEWYSSFWKLCRIVVVIREVRNISACWDWIEKPGRSRCGLRRPIQCFLGFFWWSGIVGIVTLINEYR